MKSYNSINYTLRSSKSIERKVIFEVIKEIVPPQELKNYRYIGFSSPFYADFRLVHRELGIDSLVCIEGGGDKERMEFNKPYRCVIPHGVRICAKRYKKRVSKVRFESTKT